MAIDFSFLDAAAPQPQQQAAPQEDVANVTLRVDTDAMLLCDGEFMDIQLKGGVITKVQLPVGQHLLEFLSEENPDIKVEKIVDFPVAGKSYLVMVGELKAALEQSHSQAAVALGSKRVYRLVIAGYDNQMGAMMTARTVMGWSSAESREKFAVLPAVVVESDDSARIELLAEQFAKGNVNVTVETRNGLGELVDSHSPETPAEAKRKAAEEAARKEAAQFAKFTTDELYDLAYSYRYGRKGKPKNYEEAVRYYRAAAERGSAKALYGLAGCYKSGEGVEENWPEAEKLYIKAAELGYVTAFMKISDYYYNLGIENLLKGNGDEHKSYAEALKWCRMAAERGDDWAQYRMGTCYKDGKGVEKNRSEAIKWYRKAADKGNELAADKLKELGA